MTYYGIDVSAWQGSIEWEKVSNNVDFAIIRAGFGTTIDRTAEYNARRCEALGIPFGFYWFSYAVDTKTAKNEATVFTQFAKMFTPSLPLYFDFEYDSMSNAQYAGYNISTADLEAIARAFCEGVESEGFEAGVYFNRDYYVNFYDGKNPESVVNTYRNWYAFWANTCDRKTEMWQKSSTGTIPGIVGCVDIDVGEFADGMPKPYHPVSNDSIKQAAKDVLAGKYGVGSDRYNRLKSAGFDPAVVQDLVNEWYKVANDVIVGKYSVGMERKQMLSKAGYEYDIIQGIVNVLMKGN